MYSSPKKEPSSLTKQSLSTSGSTLIPRLHLFSTTAELKSIGCYNNDRLTWISIKDHIKRCYENKTEEEWTKAFNTLKINALIVPSHYNIKIKNKFTDNTFSLYTID